MKRIGLALAILIVASLTLGILGCSDSSKPAVESSGNAAGVELTKVADVSDNPAAFDGKTITVEGNYAVGYCAACFLLKDGVSALRVEVTDAVELPPESKLNSRMRVKGKIYVANDSPNLVASQLEYL